MAPKRPSTSPVCGSTPKRSRKTITLEEKLEVLDRIKKGQRNNVIEAAMGLNEATVRTIKRNASKIRECAKAGTPLKGSKSSYTRPMEMQRMEKMLATWIDHQNKTRVPVSLALIKAKAVSIYESIEGENKKPFSASNGWFSKFQKRYGYADAKSLRLAQQVGFEDLEEEDINNLLQSHKEELTNEDLFDIERQRVKMMEKAEAAAAARPQRALTATNLSECMDLLMRSMKIIEENDPNVERSTAIIRGVMDKMACYETLLKEKQQSITIFQLRTPLQVTESETDNPDDPAASSSPHTPYTPNTADMEAESDTARANGETSGAESDARRANDHPTKVMKPPHVDVQVVEVKEEPTREEETQDMPQQDPLALNPKPVSWHHSDPQEEPQPQGRDYFVCFKEEIDVKEEDIDSFSMEEVAECVTDSRGSLLEEPQEETKKLPVKR